MSIATEGGGCSAAECYDRRRDPQVVGQGSNATVFQNKCRGGDRLVARVEPSAWHTLADAQERARTQNSINTATVKLGPVATQAFTCDGKTYLEQEKMGETLASWLKNIATGITGDKETALSKVAAALADLSDRVTRAGGTVQEQFDHKHTAAANIVMGEDERLYLVDMDTPAYFSPEQVRRSLLATTHYHLQTAAYSEARKDILYRETHALEHNEVPATLAVLYDTIKNVHSLVQSMKTAQCDPVAMAAWAATPKEISDRCQAIKGYNQEKQKCNVAANQAAQGRVMDLLAADIVSRISLATNLLERLGNPTTDSRRWDGEAEQVAAKAADKWMQTIEGNLARIQEGTTNPTYNLMAFN